MKRVCNVDKEVVVITGVSHGIGRATALLFLKAGYYVVGLDRGMNPQFSESEGLYRSDVKNNFQFIDCDITCATWDHTGYSFLKYTEYLINNAGTQTGDLKTDVDTNELALYKLTETVLKYRHVKSILNVASVSAHSGEEFPSYVISKGGLLAYTKNVAQRCAKWGCTCNSISPGGVLTDMNAKQIYNETLWNQIMAVTPLKKWATPEEIAQWIYFLTVVNKSMTGQDVLIDNGENIFPKFVE